MMLQAIYARGEDGEFHLLASAKQESEKCPMFDTCRCRSAACRCTLPDDGCPWYRWFKQRINDVENGK